MKKVVYAAMSFAPVLALAQSVGNLPQFVTNVKNLVNLIIPVFFGVAVIYFFWGLVQYLRAGGDPKAQEQGKSHMLWGIIALAVMVSVYGLINWLVTLSGVNNSFTPTFPQVP